jgi:hypothetical protein
MQLSMSAILRKMVLLGLPVTVPVLPGACSKEATLGEENAFSHLAPPPDADGEIGSRDAGPTDFWMPDGPILYAPDGHPIFGSSRADGGAYADVRGIDALELGPWGSGGPMFLPDGAPIIPPPREDGGSVLSPPSSDGPPPVPSEDASLDASFAQGPLGLDAPPCPMISPGVCQAGGRRPAGLVEPRNRRAPRLASVGSWLVQAARLEAASVPAFLTLARELHAHRAPPSLRRRAHGAAREEAVHFVRVAGLARRYRCAPALPRVNRTPVRPLENVLIENAVEGCVNETWSACLTLWQANAAADPVIAQAMASIAEDEIRHAELSWAVDAWGRSRLRAAARRRVDEARRAAAHALLHELGQERLAPTAGAVLGLPGADRAHAVAAQLAEQIWV